MNTLDKISDRKLTVLITAVLLFASTNMFFWLRSNFPMEITSPTTLTWWAGLILFIIPFMVVWVFVRSLNETWAHYGLAFRYRSIQSVSVLVVKTAVVVAATFVAMRYIFGPLARRFMTQPPDFSELMSLPGNLPGLLIALIVVWITAAFLEELLFRGFLLRNLEIIFGAGLKGKVIAILGSGILFGLMHIHQGFSGVIMTGGAGIVMGVLFYLLGRNLWPLILGHGAFNSYQLIKVYLLVPVSN